MKFFKYGIILERLKEEDIELVRQWRNSDPVRLNMNYREIITPEQQQKWFGSVDNLQNNFLLIHYQGEKIGLLNDKNIDWENRTSESGIFLGRTDYYSTLVPYLVSIAGIETTFYLLNWNKQYAHILRSNVNAIKFNLVLGYRLSNGQEGVDHQQYEITRESFERRGGKIRKAVKLIAGNDARARVLFEPADYEAGVAQKIEVLLKESPYKLEREETPEGVWYREAGVN
ncbi:MAG: GNAT family N-acetyltransferase [Bacteroidetes bacterium]|nr:GNAT family N-acetyltransferase [Bacteroidota bacterium]